MTTCMGNGEWEPDPGLVECIGKQTRLIILFIIDEIELETMYTVNCGPLPSASGYVFPYSSTLEGSSVMFMCHNDLQSELTAVCTKEGKWEPRPIDICTSVGDVFCKLLTQHDKIQEATTSEVYMSCIMHY